MPFEQGVVFLERWSPCKCFPTWRTHGLWGLHAWFSHHKLYVHPKASFAWVCWVHSSVPSRSGCLARDSSKTAAVQASRARLHASAPRRTVSTGTVTIFKCLTQIEKRNCKRNFAELIPRGVPSCDCHQGVFRRSCFNSGDSSMWLYLS